MVKYSICITCYNEVETVRQSLDSILNQIDNRFGVIVVDSLSNDGSLDVLSQYARQGKIRLIVKKCSRGVGRQIAFENSSGAYILSHMDLDDVFKPELEKLLDIYHSKFEGYLFYVNKPPNWGGVTIGTRELITRIGGWTDLQYSEDWDLWARAAKIGKFKVLTAELRESIGIPDAAIQGTCQRLKYRYLKYRELYRLGRKVFTKNERINTSQRLIVCLAHITNRLYPSYRDPFYKNFNPEAYRENPEV